MNMHMIMALLLRSSICTLSPCAVKMWDFKWHLGCGQWPSTCIGILRACGKTTSFLGLLRFEKKCCICANITALFGRCQCYWRATLLRPAGAINFHRWITTKAPCRNKRKKIVASSIYLTCQEFWTALLWRKLLLFNGLVALCLFFFQSARTRV